MPQVSNEIAERWCPLGLDDRPQTRAQDVRLVIDVAEGADMQVLACGDYVRRESDALVLALGRFVWPVHILSAALLSVLLWPHAHAGLLLPWAGWMAAFALAQGVICFRGSRRARAGAPLGRTPLAFDVSAVLLAFGWAWLALLLFPRGSLEMQNFIGFMIGGAVMTGVGTHNMHYRVLAVNLLLILPALAGRMLFEYGWLQGSVLAGMLLVFLTLKLGLGWIFHRVIRRGFVLQWEKTDLAHRLEVRAFALEAARAEAAAANAAKSRFLAQASHDLRQPLHAIGLFIGSLGKARMPARVRETVDRIGQSAETLTALFDSLLDVTLLETGGATPELAACDLDWLVDDICREMTPAAAAASVMLENRCGSAHIRTDPILVRRILQNLISNALRHAGCSTVTISSTHTGDGVFFTVRDDGRGMSQADQIRLFDEHATEGPSGGAGLGLFIVSRLCDALGVQVTLISAPDSGSAFTIGPFEAVDAPDGVEAGDAGTFESPPAGRVLVIDDDRATLTAIEALLSGWGWLVETRTGQEPDMADHLEPPDLIIADYDLGGGRTGLDAVNAIRTRYGPVQALVVTGGDVDALQAQARADGLILLRKPVRPVQLRSAILSLLG